MTLDSITIDFEITWDVAVKCLTDTFYNQDAKGRLERIQALTPPQVERMIEQALKCHGTFGQRMAELQDKSEYEYYVTVQDEVEHWLRNNCQFKNE